MGSSTYTTRTYAGLQSVDIPKVPSYILKTGSLVQGKKAYGKLREKAVSHARLDADLVWQGTHHIHSTDEAGYNLCASGTDVLTHVNSLSSWGESAQFSRSYAWRDVRYTPDFWNESTVTGEFFFHEDGLRGVFVDYRVSSVFTYPGMVFSAGDCVRRARSFRRSSDGIYETGTTGNLWSPGATLYRFTSSEISSFFGPLEGGNLISPTVFRSYGSDPDTTMLADYAALVEANSPYSSLDVSIHPVDYGDLAVECAAQLKYVESNLLFLLFDVANWRALYTQVKELVSSREWAYLQRFAYLLWLEVPGVKRNTKAKLLLREARVFGSAYLLEKYVVLPNVSDVKRLIAGLEKFLLLRKRERLHSRRVTSTSSPNFLSCTHTAVLTVVCDKYPSGITGKIQEVIGGLKKWGLYPELINLWDALHYSFVFDWIIQFGDLFRDTDQYLNMKWYFPVEYCVMSEKWVGERLVTDVTPGYPVTGVVRTSYYVRWISREVPLPSVSDSAESTLGNHLVESTALVLQRYR